MLKRLFSRRDALKASAGTVVAATIARPARVLAQAPEASPITPALIEAAQEGRQACLLHGHGPPRRRAARQGIRSQISRHRRARRALGLGAHLPAHRAGAWQQHLRGRRRQQRGCRPFRRLEAQGLARALCAGGGRASISRPSIAIPTACRDDAHLAVLARLQYQSGEARRRRPRASPTCSIRNGRARWSRPIPASAARS